jgi:hypothetical protein
VQGIHHRIVSRFLFGVTRWQKHDDVPIDRVPFQVAFKGCAVDLDVLHGNRLRTGHHRRAPDGRLAEFDLSATDDWNAPVQE